MRFGACVSAGAALGRLGGVGRECVSRETGVRIYPWGEHVFENAPALTKPALNSQISFTPRA